MLDKDEYLEASSITSSVDGRYLGLGVNKFLIKSCILSEYFESSGIIKWALVIANLELSKNGCL